MTELGKFVEYCDQLLGVDKFRDYAPNGLQIAGCEEINKLVTGVTANQALIDAAIDTLASFSVTLPKRQSWTLAMEAIAILARTRYDDELARLALQTASAIQSGVDGAQIPFIRDWADQSLQSIVALARVVEKAKHSPQGDTLEPDTSTTGD